MATTRRAFLGLAGVMTGISGLHLWLNFDWEGFMNARLPRNKRKLLVGYIPVT
jgi:hypothetical protein